MGKENKKENKKKSWWLLLLLLLLLISLGIYFFLMKKRDVKPAPVVIDTVNTVVVDTVMQDTVIDTVPQKVDTVKVPVVKKIIIKDTVIEKKQDSIVVDSFSLEEEDTVEIDPCDEDTIAPWIFPDPSGGLHLGEIDVILKSTEDATIEWRYKDEKNWKPYHGRPIKIASTRSICYKAVDSCGNKMDAKCEDYEIGKRPDEEVCPKDMAHIKIASKSFCIDKYEWPNKKGKKPSANVSLYQAQDSCFTKGKRLCTTEEWSLACAGSYSWKYAYGNRYEPRACNTRDTSVVKSGSRPECRGYFEIFDMSGNLAEWTDTKSRKNSEFYNVMGGFWQSGPQSTCFDPRYSYYPQNHHNPVGFRCCKDSGK